MSRRQVFRPASIVLAGLATAALCLGLTATPGNARTITTVPTASQSSTQMLGQSGLTRQQMHAYNRQAMAAQPDGKIPPGKAYKPPPANFKPQCPKVLTCKWVPAAHAQNDPGPFDYGNYALADRPHDLKINGIVIHETEGDLQSALANFQDQTSYVSVQYVVDTDGKVYQTVRLRDIAYQAGNFYVNMHTIGIEHVGYSETNGVTNAQYRSSAILAKWLSHKFGFPLNRSTVIGHDNVPGPTDDAVAGMHWDPGPYWDWNYYMQLLGARQPSSRFGNSSRVIIIYPSYAHNLQALQNCTDNPCQPVSPLPTNFLPLYSGPSTSSPRLSDPYIHPDGSAGTTAQNDWGDQAPTGVDYVVAARKPGWTAIWFGGQEAWFQDDGFVTRAAQATVVRSENGKPVAVYGQPLPEASAPGWQKLPPNNDPKYGNFVYRLTQAPLSKYFIEPGQAYVLERAVPDDYAEGCAKVDCTYPGDGVVVHGRTKYLQISYNHRIAYVQASDVSLSKA